MMGRWITGNALFQILCHKDKIFSHYNVYILNQQLYFSKKISL